MAASGASRADLRDVSVAKRQEVLVRAKFLTTTNGALSTAKGATDYKGIASVVRNSAGNYTVTFEDVWLGMWHFDFDIIGGAAVPANGKAQNAKVVSYNNVTKQAVIGFYFSNGAGATAADPEDGTTVTLSFWMDLGAC